MGVNDDTVQTVLRNIYVDDLCRSCATVEEAKRIVSELRDLLVSGAFHLTKFVANNDEVLCGVPPEDLSSTVELDGNRLPPHKTLGVFWDAESDTLKVYVNVKPKPHTRRGLFSMISQTYDPLGILQPFLLPARLLLQEACRNELDWDESLDHLPGLEPSWEVWFEQLSQLERISMRRNFVTNKGGRLVWCELHTFCDASTVGYGACSYLRCVYGDGSIEVNFVMGKSRVTPIKSVSVPRLELVAAVLGAKLNAKICNELDLIVNRVYYWTDALVVLRYIHNTSTRFEMFIANRLNVLHALTSVDQWKHIPGKLNPADIASRGLQPCQVRDVELWLNGPACLLSDTSEWPQQPDFITDSSHDLYQCNISNVNLSAQNCCFGISLTATNPLYRLFIRHSTFEKLLKAVAWILRLKSYLRAKVSKTKLTIGTGILQVEDYEAARYAILKATQEQGFPDAAKCLVPLTDVNDPSTRIKQKNASGSLALRDIRDLSPILLNGLLCVGGRLQRSPLPL